ncbi:hypothetical protein E2I00_000251 [Balaenoptera physalus]|uniref:Uncharacterized protein n=1 Tax=Balaenoptera physalus TaxID=9770 RepID=A0A643BXR2_BALPH|nr:hypothetical protein E2I00_000251 [Balaenoptera physalus]
MAEWGSWVEWSSRGLLSQVLQKIFPLLKAGPRRLLRPLELDAALNAFFLCFRNQLGTATSEKIQVDHRLCRGEGLHN